MSCACVQAVRVGDLAAFNALLNQYKDVFTKDKTYNLVVRFVCPFATGARWRRDLLIATVGTADCATM